MMLIDVKCPFCSKMMQYDNSRSFAFCPYCGGKVTLQVPQICNSQSKSNVNTGAGSPNVNAPVSQNAGQGTTRPARRRKPVWIIVLGVVATIITMSMITRLLPSYASPKGMNTGGENYTLALEISSENNLLLSTYDISIFFDGKELGSVSDGKTFKYTVTASGGDHELLFCKAGRSSPKISKTITVSDDMNYSCTLSHTSISIEIKSEYFIEIDADSSNEVADKASFSDLFIGNSPGFDLDSLEGMDAAVRGDNRLIFNREFNDLIIEARWWDYDSTMDKPGFYNSDTETLAFSIQMNENTGEKIYYAYYYSADKTFGSDELKKPVYSSVISPEEYGDGNVFYNADCSKRIKTGYYLVVLAKDSSLDTPYALAYAEVK